MKLHQYIDSNSPAYVILHARARAKRGKNPSTSFRGIRNPREALKVAQDQLKLAEVFSLQLIREVTFREVRTLFYALSLRPLRADEVRKALNSQPELSEVPVSIANWNPTSRQIELSGKAWWNNRPSWEEEFLRWRFLAVRS